MTKTRLIEKYFSWMYDMLCNRKELKNTSYESLLRYLFDLDFYAKLPMDANRAADGVDLRWRFAYEYRLDDFPEVLDEKPCSVLEMMVALSIRCEEQIMDDPDAGNRTSQWFWSMVRNLGLYSMTDDKFDKYTVKDIIHLFLEREYEPDGTGGLFILKNSPYDVRNVEIWYQAMWYLDEVIEGS